MSEIKVGNWVRDARKAPLTRYYGVYQVEEVQGETITLLGLGDRAPAAHFVRVRPPKDWPVPKKIPAADLWAWFHEQPTLYLSQWSDTESKAWGIFVNLRPTPIATGSTPLKAILAARKVRS